MAAVTPDQAPAFQPIAYRPADAARAIGISTNSLYELIASGRIEARKLSPQVTVIRHDELVRFIDALPVREVA